MVDQTFADLIGAVGVLLAKKLSSPPLLETYAIRLLDTGCIVCDNTTVFVDVTRAKATIDSYLGEPKDKEEFKTVVEYIINKATQTRELPTALQAFSFKIRGNDLPGEGMGKKQDPPEEIPKTFVKASEKAIADTQTQTGIGMEDPECQVSTGYKRKYTTTDIGSGGAGKMIQRQENPQQNIYPYPCYTTMVVPANPYWNAISSGAGGAGGVTMVMPNPLWNNQQPCGMMMPIASPWNNPQPRAMPTASTQIIAAGPVAVAAADLNNTDDGPKRRSWSFLGRTWTRDILPWVSWLFGYDRVQWLKTMREKKARREQEGAAKRQKLMM